jgi:hypothetical protein
VNVTAALQIEPNNAAVRSEAKKLKRMFKTHAETEKTRYRAMFGQGGGGKEADGL